MNTTAKRRNLGKGLSALLGDTSQDYASLDKVRLAKMVPVELLSPGKFQPRRRFAEEDLASLVNSVREKGILQPLVVRRHPDKVNTYEIIAGERRWRAAQQAKLHDVPVIVKDLTDKEALEIALIENIQRQDLTPIEEAAGYQRLMDEFDHTQEELSKVVGKSRSHVANSLRLLALPKLVKDYVEDGHLSAGHARALLMVQNAESLAKDIVAQGLSVRQTELLVKRQQSLGSTISPKSATSPSAQDYGKDADTKSLEKMLSHLLGLKVVIDLKGKEGGILHIHYQTLDQLDELLQKFDARD